MANLAENNIIQLCDVLSNGDIDQFIKIVEDWLIEHDYLDRDKRTRMDD